MKPQILVIETAEGIDELKAYLSDKDFLAFDTETTGLTQQDEIIGISLCADEQIAYYIITQKYDPINKVLIKTECADLAIDILKIMKEKSLIAHNGTFDCKMLNSFYKIDLMESLHTDTMILAHLLDENRRVALKELCQTYFGKDVTDQKDEMEESILKNGGAIDKGKYELYKGDPYLIAKYGAQDALLTFKLFNTLVPELFEQKLDTFFYEEESMPLLRGPTYQLNTEGLKVDLAKLNSLKKQLEAECLEAKNFISNEIKPHIEKEYPGTSKKNVFNIGSSQQLSWLLFEKLGIEFGNLTDMGKEVCQKLDLRLPYTFKARKQFIDTCKDQVGKPYQFGAIVNGKKVKPKLVKNPWVYMKCDKKELQKISNKYKWIEVLLDYQKKNKLLNTYVEGIIERTQYGIIRPSFLQHGTTSGRYASRDPNFQNLPREDKRIKECIVSRPGKSFVGADYSQLEPRVFAYFSNDSRLLSSFEGNDDFYSVIGMEVYQITDAVPSKEATPNSFRVKYKKLRDLSKVIALASTYGATARQLSSTTGKSVEDTQQDIDNYFESFPGVAKMMLESHATVKKDGQVVNFFGRPRRIPEAKKLTKMYGNQKHAELPHEARSILNLAVNHRIQSTGASICNRAMIKFLQDIKQADIADCKIVMQVHDEIIVECKDEDVDNVSLLLENAMQTAVILPGISLEAIPNSGKTIASLK